jgi:hypothetical protein
MNRNKVIDACLFVNLFICSLDSLISLLQNTFPPPHRVIFTSGLFVRGLAPVPCTISPFGVLANIDAYMKVALNERLVLPSVFRLYNSEEIRNSAPLECTNLRYHVLNYLNDIIKVCGLGYHLRVTSEFEFVLLENAIWMMVHAGRPFLVIQVQKPAQVKKKGNEEEKVSILENENMIAEVRDYMLLIRNFYGIGHVFGIATTLFEWRIVWLPDTDLPAKSGSLVNQHHVQRGFPPNLHGTAVMDATQSTAFHAMITSVVLKAYHGVSTDSCNFVATGDVLGREKYYIEVSPHSHTWSKCRDNIKELTFCFPFLNVKRYFFD